MNALDVHIGEIKIAKKGEILKAILGSCVGIGIIWEKKKICGLAHCLLPSNPERSYNIGARYVDQAFPSLMALMKIKTEDLENIRVIITGGGNMTASQTTNSDARLIGLVNYQNAVAIAQKYGMKIEYKDGGGSFGRKIIINSSDYSFNIEKIPRIDNVA